MFWNAFVPVLLAAIAWPQAGSDPQPAQGSIASEPAKVHDLRVPTHLEGLDLVIPAQERLVFYVELDVAVLGKIRVGSLVITSNVEEYRAGLPRRGERAEDQPFSQRGFIQAKAAGGYMGYNVEHEINARILPQEWPRVIVHDYQSGSENRRREVMYGTRQGKPMSWYRRDRHCENCERREHFVSGLFSDAKHCEGCKRAEHRDWDAPVMQPIPEGAFREVPPSFLARELVRTQTGRVDFPLLDKETWWDLSMVLGESAFIDTPAGTFACRAVKLDPRPPKPGDDLNEFKGLFGIHGTLSIWLDEATGVPVMIEGLVPLGPMNLDVAIVLAEYQDTPVGFKPADPTR